MEKYIAMIKNRMKSQMIQPCHFDSPGIMTALAFRQTRHFDQREKSYIFLN